ncbi:hypothetical protein AWH62_00885 [Maricaulis sp. W15]|uniref:VpaChn25_0724 family phage protein n=1 Tax=Maricaulis sp. W15 TaxID=1772333 RepID=UPI000948D893|nr:hypothetical protein [Maricaulis sp. W15]OLF81262.1 hypothetical protein AWH62_00885 [Maricaulis sp. W15]
MAFEEHLVEDARLVILKELASQNDNRLSETMLGHVLQIFGHTRSREWVRAQLRKLEEMGAVKLTEVGTVVVADLAQAGLDHVERRAFLDFVRRPSLET